MYKVFIARNSSGYKALSACRINHKPDSQMIVEEEELSTDEVKYYTVYVDADDNLNVIGKAVEMLRSKR